MCKVIVCVSVVCMGLCFGFGCVCRDLILRLIVDFMVKIVCIAWLIYGCLLFCTGVLCIVSLLPFVGDW